MTVSLCPSVCPSEVKVLSKRLNCRSCCFVTLYSEIFTIISTKGDQLNGFTYLVACHGYIFAMILYVCLIFVANKLSLSRRRSDAVSVSKCQSDGRRRSMCAFCGLVLLQIVKRILTPY